MAGSLKEADARKRLVLTKWGLTEVDRSSLKEADARKRLVRVQRPRTLVGPPAPSKKQTLESVWYVHRRGGGHAGSQPPSKKQTLESVWYPRAKGGTDELANLPSKKQTLESVWYPQTRPIGVPRAVYPSKKQTLESVWYEPRAVRAPRPRSPLKEADARKRLVHGWDSDGNITSYTPQRSRRSKASGTAGHAVPNRPRERPSKKQTLESVWYS